jgi:hypothetical protein
MPRSHDFTPALGVCGDDDHRRQCDAAAIEHNEVGGVEPQIRPVAVEGPVEEGADPFADVLAQLETWLFDAGEAPRLYWTSSSSPVSRLRAPAIV